MQRCFRLFVALSLISIATIGECSWGAPGEGQYHIQTDEGPERYFRFQTDNGQFRKEKRLQDGTVIGTEAWIDASGVLRQKDYIADKQGYRILKSKTVFVGVGRQIDDAIKSTKSTPSHGGNNGLHDRASSDIRSNNDVHNSYAYTTTTPISISSTAAPTTPEPPSGADYLSPADAAKIKPTLYLGFDHYPDELPQSQPHPHSHSQHEPEVYIHPHSEPIDDNSNSIADEPSYQIPSTTERAPAPSLVIQPPYESHYRRSRPIGVLSTTPAPIAAPVAREPYGPFAATPFSPPSADGYHYAPTTTPSYRKYAHEPYSTVRTAPVLPVDVNSLEGLLPPLPPVHHRRLRPVPPVEHINSDYLPPQEPYGFRYVLPRQYHEEAQTDEQKQAGSFGYIDPFGIQRIVYYNAGPGSGFVHRNNNRYVGVNATYHPLTE